MESLIEYARRRVALWLVLTGLVTALLVQHSFSTGKLSFEISYDDIAYFNDGLMRLDTLYAGGLPGFLREFAADPPHSPYSSLLATAAFAVLGVHDWAPYAGSAVILFVAVAAIDCLLRDVSRLARGLCLALLLTTPVVLKSVTEFRPDIACGLFTALGVAVTLREGFAFCGWKRWTTAGCLFGLALLAKPTAFPFTLGMLGLAVVLTGLCDLAARKPGVGFRGWLIRSAMTGAVAVLVALPYYLAAWRKVSAYISMVLWGDHAGELTLGRGRSFPFLFHLTGAGGQLMLGWHLYLFAALFCTGLAALAWHRRWGPLLRLTSLGLATAPAFLVPTRTGIFNPFFAATFDWLVVLAGLEAVRLTSLAQQSAPALRRAPAWGFLVLVVGAGLAAALPLRGSAGTRGDPQAALLRSAARQVIDDIRRQPRRPGPVALFAPMQPGGGSLNADLLAWHARKEGLVLAVSNVGLSEDLEVYQRQMEPAEFVLACRPINAEAPSGLDVFSFGKLAPRVLELARTQQGLTEIGHYRASGNVEFYLFKRGPALARGSEEPPP